MDACTCPPPVAEDGTWAMPEGAGPCRTWPLAPDCASCFPASTAEWDVPMRAAVESATEVLWRLSAGRFGLCREIVRPCRRPCQDWSGRTPMHLTGRWVNLGCGCGCPPAECDDCSCGTPPSTVDLPGPVHAPHLPTRHGECTWASPYPVRVWVDGELLKPDRFMIRPPGTLVRTDGGAWPQCQDLAAAYDEPGAFAVEYWRGVPVSPMGRRAVTILACELYKKCVGDTSCALPQRVQTVQREGLTFTMVDQMEFLSEGRTGLPEPDLWLSTVNPTGARSPSGVWSPDQVRMPHEGVRSASPWRRRGWRR